MVRAAAQRHGQAQRDQARQEEVEPRRVLKREPLRDRVLRRVVVVELRLYAANVLCSATTKDGERLLELVRSGDVLGVENDAILAARKLESVVASLRLGPRPFRWDDQKIKIRWQLNVANHLECLAVIFLEQQLDIHLGPRILQFLEVL